MSTSYIWEGKGRYGSCRLRIERAGMVKLWDPLRTRAWVLLRWWLRRGAVSSVCNFTFTVTLVDRERSLSKLSDWGRNDRPSLLLCVCDNWNEVVRLSSDVDIDDQSRCWRSRIWQHRSVQSVTDTTSTQTAASRLQMGRHEGRLALPLYPRGVDPRELGGSWPLKIFRRVRVCFDPVKCHVLSSKTVVG